MLRATAACYFWRSTSQIAPRCGVLWILTVKCASRHRGVPFFDIGTSKTAPWMWCFVDFDCKMCLAPQRRAIFHVSAEQLPPHRRFSKATFRRSGTTNHWENTAIRDFPNIWRVCIFFLVTLRACWSSFCWLDFPTLLFNCPYCGSYTSNFLR